MAVFVIALIFGMKALFRKRSEQGVADPSKYKQSYTSGRAKYPWADSFRNSSVFLRVGVVLALSLVIFAFSWTEVEEVIDIPEDALAMDEDIEIEPPRTAEPPPPPPPPPPPVIEEVPDDEILEEDEPEFEDMSVDESTVLDVPEPVTDAPPPPPPPPPPPEPKVEEIFKVVEDMPRFPGCEDISDKAERKRCAETKMLEFVYKNIKYPAIARENGVEGTVVITFVVNKDGSVSDARIARDRPAQLGEEALRVVNLMNDKGVKWVPGKQRGKPVPVYFNLPVKFRLE